MWKDFREEVPKKDQLIIVASKTQGPTDYFVGVYDSQQDNRHTILNRWDWYVTTIVSSETMPVEWRPIYSPAFNSEEDITIEIDDSDMLKLAMMAHKNDMTLNEYVTYVLKSQMEKHKHDQTRRD